MVLIGQLKLVILKIDPLANKDRHLQYFVAKLRVAKFELKVGSQRTTKIGNLVALDIYLVALILIPYNMQFVLLLSYQNDICLLEKEKVRIKSLKNLYMDNYFQNISPKISGSQEDNQISNFGCPHSFFGRRGHEDTHILLPWFKTMKCIAIGDVATE